MFMSAGNSADSHSNKSGFGIPFVPVVVAGTDFQNPLYFTATNPEFKPWTPERENVLHNNITSEVPTEKNNLIFILFLDSIQHDGQ